MVTSSVRSSSASQVSCSSPALSVVATPLRPGRWSAYALKMPASRRATPPRDPPGRRPRGVARRTRTRTGTTTTAWEYHPEAAHPVAQLGKGEDGTKHLGAERRTDVGIDRGAAPENPAEVEHLDGVAHGQVRRHHARVASERAARADSELFRLQSEIDELCFDLYGIAEEDRRAIRAGVHKSLA